jgi:hypothetical protein
VSKFDSRHAKIGFAGGTRVLTPHTVWSPARATIAFVAKHEGNSEIYDMNADGKAQRNLTGDLADDEDPSWSPDGRKIAFVSDRDGQSEVYVMNADGATVRRLTHAAGGKSKPVWSPDGRKIAFINRNDRAIYVMNADGSQIRKVLAGVDRDGGLAWQPRAQQRRAPVPEGVHPRTTTPAEAELCKLDGIRYVGTTAQGAKVCFTLTADASAWIEIAFSFVRASACPNLATGTAYSKGPSPLDAPGRIKIPGSFTATLRGAGASGVLEDSNICGNKTFKWTARRAP